MKQKKSIESFDDIVFHNRNKAYGAYYLRKRYYKGLIPGSILTLLMPFIFVIFQALQFFEEDFDSTVDPALLFNQAILEEINDITQLNEPPPKSEEEEKTESEKNTIPEVVDSLIVDSLASLQNQLVDSLNKPSDSISVASSEILNPAKDIDVVIYFAADTLPEFPGGNMAMVRFLVKNIRYPEIAIKNNITGVVYITFCVKNDGSLDKVKIHKGVNSLLDNEALRVVKSMPNWKPGRLKSKNVNVMFTLPINFSLGSKSG